MVDAAAPGLARADYGLDAPGLVRGFLLAGAALCLASVVCRAWGASGAGAGIATLGRALPWPGGTLLAMGLLMILSSRYGKLRARDDLLDRLRLRGDETVLDVGCGHGLLLIGAAKRLPRGRALGIDLWSQVDQGDNSPAATLANARAEGVEGRVEVRDGDMRTMPFPDATFDAVVSSLAIHNVPDRQGRRAALAEIARVLRPGGRLALLDIAHTSQYAADLRELGMRDVTTRGPIFWIYPPVRVVTGHRAAD